MPYSANDNQNYFVHAGRTTSRVLAQPGGQTSFTLGGWTPEELERQRLRKEQKEAAPDKEAVSEKQDPSNDITVEDTGKENQVMKQAEKKVASKVEDSTPHQPESSGLSLGKPPVSSNAFASSSTTNSFNVVTDRPTSRVTRPPGGYSSIRLG